MSLCFGVTALAAGWRTADTVTPDGYQVNRDGAWVENGAVMTREVQTQKEEQSAVSGNQLVVYFSRTGTTESSRRPLRESVGAFHLSHGKRVLF